MITRRFGRTELMMPVFSCGGMRYQASWTPGQPIPAANQANLEATLRRGFELGVNHVETARGYGTSEQQLGVALNKIGNKDLILQTKVTPREDPLEFERGLEESFERLQVERVDLFGFHGINNQKILDYTLRKGGCYEIAEKFRKTGRIGHFGFSTHGETDIITKTIETGLFSYVNLHWYYINQDNLPALKAARAMDMGVFIISPSDKGGMLQAPPQKLRDLCQPLSPMAFNDLFCLSQNEISTLSLGAARPADFDEHMTVLSVLSKSPQDIASKLDPIRSRLADCYERTLGKEFSQKWHTGIPPWQKIPGRINVKTILWLRNLAEAFDLDDFARYRYRMLSEHDHWVPGNQAREFDDLEMRKCLKNNPYANQIPEILRETHAKYAKPDM